MRSKQPSITSCSEVANSGFLRSPRSRQELPSCRTPSHSAAATGAPLFLPRYGPSLTVAVLSAMTAAHDAAEVESAAVLRIQSAFRGRRERANYLHVRGAIICLQRVTRGFLQRRRGAAAAARAEQQRLRCLFDAFATRIQALYRGHRARRTRYDYYQQKAYLAYVGQQTSTVREAVATLSAERATLARGQEQDRARAAYVEAIRAAHPKVSTAATPGVFGAATRTARGAALGYLTTGPDPDMNATTLATTRALCKWGSLETDGHATQYQRSRALDTELERDIRTESQAWRQPQLAAERSARRRAAKHQHEQQKEQQQPQPQQTAAVRSKTTATPTPSPPPAPPAADETAGESTSADATPTTPLVLPPIVPTTTTGTTAAAAAGASSAAPSAGRHTPRPASSSYAPGDDDYGAEMETPCAWRAADSLPPPGKLAGTWHAATRTAQRRHERETMRQARQAARVVPAVPHVHDCLPLGTQSARVDAVEVAAAQRRVNEQVMAPLHGGAPFKVSLYPKKT